MPTTSRADTQDLNATLTVSVPKSDYEPKLNSELQKYRKQAQMKGFRKGHTPMSVVKKMYGRSLLAEVINDLMQQELYRYLTEEDIEILGQPLPSDEQEPLDFDIKNPGDYEIKFDVGLAPDFEVQGIDADNSFSKYVVDIPDSEVDEALDSARRRQGKRMNPETIGDDNDVVQLNVLELDGDEVNEDGVESEFSLLLSRIDDEKVKKSFYGKKVDDSLVLNLFELEKDTDEAYVRKHFLKLDDGDEREVGRSFKAIIKEISRVEEAELDEEFFEAAFPGKEIKTEEEAREAIRDDISQHFQSQAEALVFRDIQDSLLEKNQLPLPDAFLKRWLLTNNEEASEEIIDKEYAGFSENLKWSLIKGKLVKRFDLEVSKDDIAEKFREQVRGYFGGSTDNEQFVDSMVQRLMGDRKQYDTVYEDLMADKLFDAVVAEVAIEEKPIDFEAFQEVLEEARKESEKARAQAAQDEEE